MKLSDFDALTFDCCRTLIDWENGLRAAFTPLLFRIGKRLPRDAVQEAFALPESGQQALTPAMPYCELLTHVQGQLAIKWGATPDPAEDARFGQSVNDWPPFPIR